MLFLLRTKVSSIRLIWFFQLLALDSWHFAQISPRGSRRVSSPSISWFVTTPNGNFPLTSNCLPRKACTSLSQGEPEALPKMSQHVTISASLSQVDFVRWVGQSANQPANGLNSSRCASQQRAYAAVRNVGNMLIRGVGMGAPALWPLIWEASVHFLQDGAIVLLGLLQRIHRRTTM